MTYYKLSCIALFLFLHLQGVKPACDHKKEIICYYASWSLYRLDKGQFNINDIDPTVCTNIVYSFAGLNIDLQIDSLDPNADITKGGFYNFTQIKAQNPCVRTTLAVGGWNEGSLKYSVMAADEGTRQAFAESALKFIAYYGFDGLDLDWEFPTRNGGISEDKKNFVSLLQTLKEKLSPWGFTLSVAVTVDDTAYDVPSVAENVDYIHLMAYDMTLYPSRTGLVAPIDVINTMVIEWISKGAAAHQLILGIPTYAHCYNLMDPNDHDVGAEVQAITTCGGVWTDQNGYLSYYEVLEMRLSSQCEDEVLSNSNVYSSCGDVWMSYDNTESVAAKCQYVQDIGLGGVMLWSIDTDDFMGLYGEKYPLLTTAYSVLNG